MERGSPLLRQAQSDSGIPRLDRRTETTGIIELETTDSLLHTSANTMSSIDNIDGCCSSLAVVCFSCLFRKWRRDGLSSASGDVDLWIFRTPDSAPLKSLNIIVATGVLR